MTSARLVAPGGAAPRLDRAPWFALPAPPVCRKQAMIIGAGSAGCQAAWHLAAHGWQVTVLEQNAEPGAAGSGVGAAERMAASSA